MTGVFGSPKGFRDKIEAKKGTASMTGTSKAITIAGLTTSSCAVVSGNGDEAGTLSYVITANTLTVSSTSSETALTVSYVVFK